MKSCLTVTNIPNTHMDHCLSCGRVRFLALSNYRQFAADGHCQTYYHRQTGRIKSNVTTAVKVEIKQAHIVTPNLILVLNKTDSKLSHFYSSNVLYVDCIHHYEHNGGSVFRFV